MIELIIARINGDQYPTESDFNLLSESMRCGFVSTPNDDNFEQLSSSQVPSFDLMAKPSALIMCQCEEDVIIATKWMHQFLDKITFRIRSGGHSFAAYSKSLDGIVIDLSLMKNIQINELFDGQLSIEPGVRLSEFEQWKQDNLYCKITIPHGTCPGVGIGGYITGGGIGLTSRQWGPASDYLKGVRVVLCDGSLWEIFEDIKNVTRCISGCNATNGIWLNYDDLQSALFAVKGGGGGNFGVITKYYVNGPQEPQFIHIFKLSFPILTRQNIYNSYQTYRNILSQFKYIEDKFGLFHFIAPELNNDNDDYPTKYDIKFGCIYFATDQYDNTLEIMIHKIVQYMETNYIESNSFISTNITLTEAYNNIIFPIHDYNGIDSLQFLGFKGIGQYALKHKWIGGFASTRQIMKEQDFSEEYMNALTDQLYQHIVAFPVAYIGIGMSLLLEATGGTSSVPSAKSSFPNQNRDSWSLIANGFYHFVPPLRIVAQSLRDIYEKKVFFMLGNKKYINYVDDISIDLTQYYSEQEIERLSDIQKVIDPHQCFRFQLGINQNGYDEKVPYKNGYIYDVMERVLVEMYDNYKFDKIKDILFNQEFDLISDTIVKNVIIGSLDELYKLYGDENDYQLFHQILNSTNSTKIKHFILNKLIVNGDYVDNEYYHKIWIFIKNRYKQLLSDDTDHHDIDGDIIQYVKQNEEVRYWLHKLFDIKIDSVSNLQDLLSIISRKLPKNKVIQKILQYAEKMDVVKYWLHKLLDITIESSSELTDFLETIFFELFLATMHEEGSSDNEKCRNWVESDKEKYPGEWWKSRDIPTCPSIYHSDKIQQNVPWKQWEIDRFIKEFHEGAAECINRPSGQQCCYQANGDLCVGPPCGGTLNVAPVQFPWFEHFKEDVMPYIWCKNAGMLEVYYERRPSVETETDGDTDRNMFIHGMSDKLKMIHDGLIEKLKQMIEIIQDFHVKYEYESLEAEKQMNDDLVIIGLFGCNMFIIVLFVIYLFYGKTHKKR